MKDSFEKKMRLSPSELACELSMNMNEYLLVEGGGDKKIWEHMQVLGLKARKIIMANNKDCDGNKDYVKEVMSIIEGRKKQNVVGIIDMDYDFVGKNMVKINNLFYYKYLDLENILVKSLAFKEVNTIISSKQKLIDSEKLLNRLYEKTYVLGLMRFLNGTEQYNLDFKNLDYGKILNNNEDQNLEYLMRKNSVLREDQNKIESKIKELESKHFEYKYVCNGHDILNILSQMTKKEIASDTPIKYTEEMLLNMLILGFRKSETSHDVDDCFELIYEQQN